MGLVGRFREGESGEESADEEADIGSKAEVGFVDCAHGGGNAVGEEGTDPVFGFGAYGIGAEGVDMVSDGSSTESGSGKFEGSFKVPCVPAGVEGDLIPRDPFGGNLGLSIDLDIESAGLEKDGGLLNPAIPHAVGVVFFLNGADIEKGATGEFGFFCFDGIFDHAADDGGCGAIEPADHDEIVRKKLAEGANAFVGEVGIGDDSVGRQAAKWEKGEFRINRGSVGAELSHEGFGRLDGGIFCDFERDTPHENHDPDGIIL